LATHPALVAQVGNGGADWRTDGAAWRSGWLVLVAVRARPPASRSQAALNSSPCRSRMKAIASPDFPQEKHFHSCGRLLTIPKDGVLSSWNGHGHASARAGPSSLVRTARKERPFSKACVSIPIALIPRVKLFGKNGKNCNFAFFAFAKAKIEKA
jgi:hypothetical protein